jgi:Bacterial dipeptidyl-peptidase Sh3 domain
VIASHYASPVARTVKSATVLRSASEQGAEAIAQLAVGTTFALLDDSLGWAWGYAGEERRVGYVPSSALAPRTSD